MLKFNILSSLFNLEFRHSRVSNPGKSNKWLSPKNWGASMSAIDFSGNQTLLKDDRVHKIYKKEYPTLCQDYVLWRVEHDGSCWVSSGITQLIYQMVESGPGKFDEVVDYFKQLVASDQEVNTIENQDVAHDLFAILELVRKEMDHRFGLALRNHRNVYEALDRGFRKILSLYWKKQDTLKSTRINTAFSLGYAADFKELFDEIGLKYAEILTDGECDGAPATISYVNLAAYLTEQELNLLSREDEIAQRNYPHKKMPPIMAFLTAPGFMDVAVKKEISDHINANTLIYSKSKLRKFIKSLVIPISCTIARA